jgi:HEAT repeat protein
MLDRWQLEKLKKGARKALAEAIKCLSSHDADARFNALVRMAKWVGMSWLDPADMTSAVAAVNRFLSDADPRMRGVAALTLGAWALQGRTLGPPELLHAAKRSEPEVRRLLGDEDTKVMESAKMALGQMGCS